MPEFLSLRDDLNDAGFGQWYEALQPILADNFADNVHGDLPAWKSVVESLPSPTNVTQKLTTGSAGGDGGDLSAKQIQVVREQLMKLRPWRKGPFNILGINIDSEWRSNWKWTRIAPQMSSLQGRKVLDVGCGNGYYALRMKGVGASLVIGIDPTLLFICQFMAISRLLNLQGVHALPLRLQELPKPVPRFDTTFSMGVLYHQRQPDQHLAELHTTLRPGGELILETLILPGDLPRVLEPEDRYARMRNVWHLPSISSLLEWIANAGFVNARVVDVSVTSVDEQRPTSWMTFDSLAHALDPDDPGLTIEGHPAPTRATVICETPG